MNKQTQDLYKDLIIIDGHCDTVLDLAGESFTRPDRQARDFFIDSDWGHIDLPKLKKAGITCQTMALYTPDSLVPHAREHTIKMSDKIDHLLREDLLPALKSSDIIKTKTEGKTALLKAIEGGEAIGESLDTLKDFYDRGVRMLGLTYNRINPLGRGCGTPGTSGLTPFGKSVVKQMAKLGMIVDVSHLSDEGLDDLIKITELPVVASHSNSRHIRNHKRNLSDSQLEAIARTGGVAAITYAGLFVHEKPENVTFERLMEHLDHMLHIVGPKHIALGSDFDGFTVSQGICMNSCLDTPKITSHLMTKGWENDEIAMIMGGNWLRVIKQVVG